MFQSTRPRGARRNAAFGDSFGWGVSIHAPAWGATLFVSGVSVSIAVSIHAPAWGATRNSPQ